MDGHSIFISLFYFWQGRIAGISRKGNHSRLVDLGVFPGRFPIAMIPVTDNCSCLVKLGKKRILLEVYSFFSNILSLSGTLTVS
jgi:hypothetical protein